MYDYMLLHIHIVVEFEIWYGVKFAFYIVQRVYICIVRARLAVRYVAPCGIYIRRSKIAFIAENISRSTLLFSRSRSRVSLYSSYFI